ncbi:MAG: hypothetical protein Hyperionvirus2_14 [Hyperionvirus sp.]|uniref:Uncharacterized protein n=1 Tax=Hyperionvirus sp. TaxID=2487770 RepID=A0A3G5A5X5_9VIRU|nr:MAG: hypothetical protein Hyperionvirus2_14 [Hyperionvirus sp.]
MSAVNQVYDPLGHLAFELGSAETKKIDVNVKLRRKSNVLVGLGIFFNVLSESISVTFDIKRDGDSLINGPQIFVKEAPGIGGEYAVPYALVDEVGSGKHKYSLELHNSGEDTIKIDHYSFSVKKIDNFAVNQKFIAYGDVPVEIKGKSKKNISIVLERSRKGGGFLYFSASVNNSGGQQISFNILKNGMSITNGSHNLVALAGIYVVNWGHVDCNSEGSKYQFVLENNGVSSIQVMSYSFIGIRSATIASNALYGVAPNIVKSFPPSLATEFKLKGFGGVNTISLNFEVGFVSANANIYYNIVRDDGVSVTNGPQPWVLSFGDTTTETISTNNIIVDQCAPETTKFYTIEMINQDSVAVIVPFYSITNIKFDI